MSFLDILFESRRYFVFSFTCGETTGYIDIITENREFPSQKKIHEDVRTLIQAKVEEGAIQQEDTGRIIICNIFEFKNERDYKNWTAK